MKRLLVLVCCGFVAAVTALPASSAQLSSINVSGAWVPTAFGTPTCRPAASLLFCSTTDFLTDYSGSLTGSSTNDFVQVNNCVTGRARGIGIEKFTGSITGVGSGTLTWILPFSATVAGDCFSPTSFEADGFIIKGTGALARVRGTLHFTFDGYSGSLRF
jgi:hypothetical protein